MTSCIVKYNSPICVEGNSLFQKQSHSEERESLLHSILPPKTWVDENGKLWKQYISSIPAAPSDVTKLRENIDLAISDSGVKYSVGICEKRHNIYASAFVEVIRQVSIACAESGLVLQRIREEINMTINAYRTLFESSFTYGIRKSLLSSLQLKSDTTLVQELRDRNKKLRGEITIMKNKIRAAKMSFDIDRDQHEENEKIRKDIFDRNRSLQMQLRNFFM